jgi:hypothetical protein
MGLNELVNMELSSGIFSSTWMFFVSGCGYLVAGSQAIGERAPANFVCFKPPPLSCGSGFTGYRRTGFFDDGPPADMISG